MTPRALLAVLGATIALSGSSATAQVAETETPVESAQVANGSSSPTTTSPVSVTAISPTTTTITIAGVATNLTETVTFQPPSSVKGYSGTLGSSTGTSTAGVGGFAGSSAAGSAAPSAGTSFGAGAGFGPVTASGPVYVDVPGMTPGVTP
ncbi:MAG TPA: hypothetical protein VF765_11900 [Polyangiaceae bacterium]